MSEMGQMDVVATVRAIVARVESTVASTEQRPYKVLEAIRALPDLENVDGLTFRHHEYEIRAGLTKPLEEDIKKLRWLASLEIAAAPEVVALIPVGVSEIGDESVLIARYRCCPGEQLIKALSTQEPFREDAVERFVGDMRKLIEHGAVHPYADRGFHHWLVSSRTGALLLDSWSALRTCDPEQGAEILDHLAERLMARQASIKTQARTMNRIEAVFGVSRVLLPVIHPIGWDEALKSIQIARDAKVKGVFLIDQGMSADEVLELVLETRKRFPELWVGVNLLSAGSPAKALRLALDACEGRIDGLWTDNAGIDEAAGSQPAAQEFLDARRERGWTGLYFGGVAFKYQRPVPNEKLALAALAAAPFVDVICTSGAGTGQAAEVEKPRVMREAVGPEVPMALASGVTDTNVSDYLPYVDAFLVGTGIEEKLGVLHPEKLARLQQIIASSTRG